MQTETLSLSHGYKAEIAIDDFASNPFEEFDCEPPTLTFFLNNYSGELTRYPKNGNPIDFDYFLAKIPEENRTETDEITEYPRYWSEAKEYFESLESLAKLAGIPCYNGQSNGYCQGDSCLVFVCATPEWTETVGAPEDSLAHQCKGAFNLFSAWAWSDVWGVVSVINPEGNEIEDSSCWGFYGSDHAENGLLDYCESMVEHDLIVKRETEMALCCP